MTMLRWLAGRTLADSIAGDLMEERRRRGTLWFWRSSLAVDGNYLVTTAFRDGRACTAASRAELERLFPPTASNLGDEARSAYALPLVVGGAPIGAFGLVFEKEHVVEPEDERLLATMTDLCAQALERARLYESEHRIALRLQRALLPDRVVQHPSVTIAARYEASSDTMEVGGDWYDTFELPDGRIGVAVGDVVGHGIEAAASMGRLRSAFAAFAAAGLGEAQLGVASDNPRAMTLYEQVGMTIRFCIDTYERPAQLATAPHPGPGR
jgi:hypothetical protein